MFLPSVAVGAFLPREFASSSLSGAGASSSLSGVGASSPFTAGVVSVGSHAQLLGPAAMVHAVVGSGSLNTPSRFPA